MLRVRVVTSTLLDYESQRKAPCPTHCMLSAVHSAHLEVSLGPRIEGFCLRIHYAMRLNRRKRRR